MGSSCRRQIQCAEIVYILDHYPVLSQTFVTREIGALREAGVDVAIISLRKPKSARHADAFYLDRHIAAVAWSHLRYSAKSPISYVKYLKLLASAKGESFVWCLAAPYVARNLAPGQRVHVHFGLRSALVSRLVCPFTFIRRSLTLHAIELYRRPRNIEFKCAGAQVITISEFNAVELKNRYHVSSTVAYCGVDPVESDHRLVGERAPIMCAGRLVEKKGFDIALRAVALLRDRGQIVNLMIVGDGPERAKLLSLARDLSIADQCVFWGSLSHDATLELMNKSKALLAPFRRASNGDMDGLPLVVVEAMARSVPIVGTAISGLSEVVYSETAWTIETDSFFGVADALSNFLDSSPQEIVRKTSQAKALAAERHTMSAQILPLTSSLGRGVQ